MILTYLDISCFNFTPPRYIVLQNIGIWDIPKKIRYIEFFRFSGYGISQGYTKKNPVHRIFQIFGIWDIPRYIPKNFRYIENLYFFGIWDIPGISHKISGTSSFFHFFGTWDILGISQNVKGIWLSLNFPGYEIYQSPWIYPKISSAFIFSLSLFFFRDR